MIFKSKHGVGIMEVMIAALVLGLLYTAVSNLQRGNREALLRIRGRDGATEVAQNVIDSLGALGLAAFSDANPELFADDGTRKSLELKPIVREWVGQPGIRQNTMSVTYNVTVDVSPDDAPRYRTQSESLLLLHDPDSKCGDPGTNCSTHVFAKRIDVTVSWNFKRSKQSITVSGVIR